ncbi:MAG: hypothetical protein V7603_6810 [Micromonosporaceae bacterium]
MENSPDHATERRQPRTGAEQPWDPPDASPGNVERSREELDREGPAAIEKTVP